VSGFSRIVAGFSPTTSMKLPRAAVSLVLVAAAVSPVIARTAPRTPQTAPPRDTRPTSPTGTAVIRGRIVAADTNRPVSLATITASASELRESRSISTNSEGRYELRNLPAGRYTLSVSRSGYLPLQYGQRRPLEQGKVLQISDAQAVDNVDFVLPRMSVISGRILDEEGEPVAGAQVSATQVVFGNGRRPTFPAGSGAASTNASGQYRITGLSPGDYIVSGQSLFETWKGDGVGNRMMGYARTYYPGTSSASGARRIPVGIGQEIPNVDFSLIPGRMATISGTVVDSRGRPVAAPIVALSQSSPGLGGTIVLSAAAGPNSDRSTDGSFTVGNLLPGEYTLSVGALVDTGAGRIAEAAFMPIVVDSSDLNLVVTLSGGWSVAGRIVGESGPPAGVLPNQIRIAAVTPFVDMGPVRGLAASTSAGNGLVKDDWTFTISGVFGPARLVPRVPDGWTIKAIIQDGRDISGKLIEGSGDTALPAVQIVVSNRPASVEGQVTDANGAATTEGTVILFADDSGKWFENSRYVRAARPDQKGRYEIKGMPPGVYLGVALDYVPDRIWNDPEYLESIRRYAQKVALTEGAEATMSLTLVSP
jgi:protocatechuate 3,4-dioxygenase beta subunit